MSRPAPLISVLMPTFNHENYIEDAIRSVLQQSFTDWQLIVVNDGSTDDTSRRMRALWDPRIVCLDQDNQGPNAATNRALAAARGKYVAWMSGDDLCCPDRLERQLQEYLRGPRRILFGHVDFIDDDGRPLEGPHFASELFEQRALTRAQTLERFFRQGNFLNSITAFTERQVMQEAGVYDLPLFQLSDFEMWIRLVKKYPLEVMPHCVVHYRIRRGAQNLSSPEPEHVIRSMHETYLIMRRFFEGVSPELFQEAFGQQLIHADCSGDWERRCEEAFLYVGSSSRVHQLIGMERLHELLADPDGAAVLKQHYDFTAVSLARMLKTFNVFDLYSGQESNVYVDSGEGWQGERRVSRTVNLTSRDFNLSFDLSGLQPVRCLRWDPMEVSWGRVRLEQAWLRRPDGGLSPVDMARVWSNGTRLEDGTFVFETLDPSIVLPVEGEVTGLVVQGKWQCAPLAQTAVQMEARLLQSKEELRQSKEELRQGQEELQLMHCRAEKHHEGTQELRLLLGRKEEEWQRHIDHLHEELSLRDRHIAHLAAHGAGPMNLRNWHWLVPLRRLVSKVRHWRSGRRAG